MVHGANNRLNRKMRSEQNAAKYLISKELISLWESNLMSWGSLLQASNLWFPDCDLPLAIFGYAIPKMCYFKNACHSCEN